MRRTRVLILTTILFLAGLAVPVVMGQAPSDASVHLPTVLRHADHQPQPTLSPPTARPYPSATPGAPCTPPAPPDKYHLDDVVISLDRGPCFGFCPEYTVTIEGNGHVTWEGRRNVQEIGIRTDDIGREAVVELLTAFYDADFFALRDAYREESVLQVDDLGNVERRTAMVTDLPQQEVRLVIGPYAKTVIDYWKPPETLRALEARIDETAGTARWVGRVP